MNDRISRYMLFSCGDRRYAVDVDTVDEISELLPEYPVPGAPRFLKGVVSIHGKLAAVIDLSMYLGRGPMPSGRNLLLLKLPGTGLAIVVSQMERIIFEDEIILSEPGISDIEKSVLTLKDGTVTLLQLNSLVDSIEAALV